MKAKIGLLALILVLSASLSLAQSPQRLSWWASPWASSFRNASTAGLLEDDLDLMLDPARLPIIQGSRLYTSLSNLVGKGDELFNNTGNQYYLLGGSGKIMDFGYGGLLYDRNLQRAYDTVTVSQSTLVDLDANGTYDRKTLVEQTSYSSTNIKTTDWWIGYGRELGPGKFGALFYHSVNNSATEPSLTNTTITASDLVTGIVTSLTKITNHEHDITNSSLNGGALSYWYPFNDKLDFGLAGGINLRKAEQFDSISYDSKQTDPSVPGANGTTIDSTATGDIIPWDHIGMDVIGRVAAVYKWSDMVKTRTDVYFSMLVGGKKDDGFRKTSYVNTVAFQLIAPLGTEVTSTNRTRDGKVVQEDHLNAVGLQSNTYVKFSDKVEMSIGLGLDSYNRDFTNTFTAAYSEIVTFDDGDPANFTDYSNVTTGTTTQVQKYTESHLAISTPVCVEFHVTKPFVVRLGADHYFVYQSYTDNETSEINPLVTTHTDAFGVVTQSKPTPFVNGNGQSTYHKAASSYLDYTYGAGWEISKNLQIDLMGFAKLDDLTNWKLSAVFKF